LRIDHAALIALLLMTSSAVLAQTEAGLVAHGLFSSQPNQFANVVTCVVNGCGPPPASRVNPGVSFEGFVAHKLASFHVASLSVELPLLAMPNRGTNLAGRSFSTLAVTPGLRLNLGSRESFSPFLSAGGGFAHFSGDAPSVTKGAVLFGGGVDFKTPLPHLGVRVEVKDLITPWPSLFLKSGVMQNAIAGGGVVFKF